jgi:hypothetical protein
MIMEWLRKLQHKLTTATPSPESVLEYTRFGGSSASGDHKWTAVAVVDAKDGMPPVSFWATAYDERDAQEKAYTLAYAYIDDVMSDVATADRPGAHVMYWPGLVGPVKHVKV